MLRVEIHEQAILGWLLDSGRLAEPVAEDMDAIAAAIARVLLDAAKGR